MNHAIILAAGQGQRMKSDKDKLLLQAGGYPVIYHSLIAFNDHPKIESVTIVVNKFNKVSIEKIANEYNLKKAKKIIIGGKTRQNSLEVGLKSLERIAKKDDIILVHNAANPLVSQAEIDKVIEESISHGACIVGHYITSTIKEIDDKNIVKTHDRKKLFAAETPQSARFSIFQKAILNAQKKHIEATDEAMLLEAIGQKIVFLEADENNFKITTESDHAKLKAVLGDLPEDFRVGIGQDSHSFDEKEMGLTLGGIFLKDEKKLKANSDGDVILHAIFNALSQAIGEMSLGFYADKVCEAGIKDSKKYLQPLLKKIKKQGFKLNSLGVMLECKKPKIDPLVSKIKKSLSEILALDSRRIGITATSGEELTAFGNGAGIQCFAIASLIK